MKDVITGEWLEQEIAKYANDEKEAALRVERAKAAYQKARDELKEAKEDLEGCICGRKELQWELDYLRRGKGYEPGRSETKTA
jgi:hypothetical protein